MIYLTTGPNLSSPRWSLEDPTELLESASDYLVGLYARDDEIDALIVENNDGTDVLHRIGTWDQRETKQFQASELHSQEGIVLADSYGSTAVVFRGDGYAWVVPPSNADELVPYVDRRFGGAPIDNKHKKTYRQVVADYSEGYLQLMDPVTGDVLLTRYFGFGRVTATWHALITTGAGAE